MGEKTSIEWTDSSWNPIRARNKETGAVGWHCSHPSPGCENCYAENLNLRLGTRLPFKPGHLKHIEMFLDAKLLAAPLHWKRPRMVFVCSMTDIFGEFVDTAWIDLMFAVMALSPQHTFQVLTKRADRMRFYFNDPGTAVRVDAAMNKIAPAHWHDRELDDHGGWPLKNVWAGVSAEDQKRAEERIPTLNNTNAAKRFVSIEPQIGRIDLCEMLGIWWNQTKDEWIKVDDRVRPDLLIIGGESGSKARDFHYSWARSLVTQAAGAGIRCFVKQVGAKPVDDLDYPRFSVMKLKDRKGGDMAEWPEALRVRQGFDEPEAKELF